MLENLVIPSVVFQLVPPAGVSEAAVFVVISSPVKVNASVTGTVFSADDGTARAVSGTKEIPNAAMQRANRKAKEIRRIFLKPIRFILHSPPCLEVVPVVIAEGS